MKFIAIIIFNDDSEQNKERKYFILLLNYLFMHMQKMLMDKMKLFFFVLN